MTFSVWLAHMHAKWCFQPISAQLAVASTQRCSLVRHDVLQPTCESVFGPDNIKVRSVAAKKVYRAPAAQKHAFTDCEASQIWAAKPG